METLSTVGGSSPHRGVFSIRIQRLEAERKYALELLPETIVEPGVEKDVVAGGRHCHRVGKEEQ